MSSISWLAEYRREIVVGVIIGLIVAVVGAFINQEGRFDPARRTSTPTSEAIAEAPTAEDQDFQPLFTMTPATPDPTATILKEVIRFYNEGTSYYKDAHYEEAIAAFTQAIDRDRNFVEAYYWRGQAHGALEEYEQAIADFTKAIDRDSNFAEAYYWRGRAYLQQEEYDKAIADFTEAIIIDDKFAEAYDWRGLAYLEIGDLEAAQSDFSHADKYKEQ